ncbi:MAG: hypothetical protein ABI557_20150 [Aureliella sp.]
MDTSSLVYVEYLHDAEVHLFMLGIDDSGQRVFRLKLRCDPECGLEAWNDRWVDIEFIDPVIVLTEMYGHMVNAETFNAWNEVSSELMQERIGRLTEIGIPNPKHTVQLVFHSGSVTEVACEEIRLTVS